MVRAQRIGDVDDDVHSAADCSDGLPCRPCIRRAPLYALYAADVISLAGNAVAQLAIPWFVLTTTGSAALTALAVFFNFLPIVLGGVLRRSGRRPAGIPDDERRRRSRERRRGRRDPAAALRRSGSSCGS